MARARLLKPGFFMNSKLGALPPLARLLFQGLWCLADREGRLKDEPLRIRIQVLPYDERAKTEDLLNQLTEAGFILRYQVADESYIQVVNFTKHQKPHFKEPASEIPAPDGHSDSLLTLGDIPREIREQVLRRDGYRCIQCGAGDRLSLDHIIPRIAGGPNTEANLRVLCTRCNSSKGGRYAPDESSNQEPYMEDDSPSDGPTSRDPAALDPEALTLNPIPDPVTRSGGGGGDRFPGMETASERSTEDTATTVSTEVHERRFTRLEELIGPFRTKPDAQLATRLCAIRDTDAFSAAVTSLTEQLGRRPNLTEVSVWLEEHPHAGDLPSPGGPFAELPAPQREMAATILGHYPLNLRTAARIHEVRLFVGDFEGRDAEVQAAIDEGLRQVPKLYPYVDLLRSRLQGPTPAAPRITAQRPAASERDQFPDMTNAFPNAPKFGRRIGER